MMHGMVRRHRRSELLKSLWLMPSAAIVGSLLVGYLLSRVEARNGKIFGVTVFTGSAESARQLLAVVAGTMVTVTGLVFVLTVVALQIASTQFSPRLLRAFLRDFGTRAVLSTFVATFAYSLAGLFTVGRIQQDGTPFVPRVAIAGSLGLALMSVAMLVYYIQHITNAIRIDTVMAKVERETLASIHLHHEPAVGESDRDEPPTPPADAAVIYTDRSGYLQHVNVGHLANVAMSHDAVVRLRPEIGHYLVAGSPIGWVWPASAGHTEVARLSEAQAGMNSSMVVVAERTTHFDFAFGLRQLVDVAIKAVAPSINDPYTSVQAIQHLSVVMSQLATVNLDPVAFRDESEKVRVYVPTAKFSRHLDTVCGHVRRVAKDRPRIVVALLRLLEVTATSTSKPSRRDSVARQAELVLADALDSIDQIADLEEVHRQHLATMLATEHGKAYLGSDY